MIRALAERSPGRYALIHPVSRWRGRTALRLALPDVETCAYAGGWTLRRRFDLVHALDTRVPRFHHGPLAATLYDVFSALPESADLAFSTAAFRRKKLEYYRRTADRAGLIVTISEDSRRQIVEHFSPRCPVVVVPPGLEAPPQASLDQDLAVLAALGISSPFLLAVGALSPRKNPAGAVAVWQRARRQHRGLKLVLAGAPETSWAGSPDEAAVRRAGDDILITGYLERPALWAAYRGAAALLHLSHHEGFGLPVLEALSAGTPVLASSRGGIPEAGGGAAWLVDPGDHDLAASVLLDMLAGPRDLAARRDRGIEHAKLHTWARAAALMEAHYHDLAQGGGTS